MQNSSEDWKLTFLNKLKELKSALYLFGDKSSFIYSILSSYLSTAGFSSNFQNLNNNKINLIIDEAIYVLEGNPNCKGLLLAYSKDKEIGIISIDLVLGNFSNHSFSSGPDLKSEIESRLNELKEKTGQDILWKSSYLLSKP